MNRLVDVDVDGVHLVGEPANKRRFAIVKGLVVKGRLADFLNRRIDGMADDDAARAEIIERMGGAADIDVSTVNQILRGEIDVPPENRLRGFARVLGVGLSALQGLLPARKGDPIVKKSDFLEKLQAQKDKGAEVTPELFVELFGKDAVVKALGIDSAALEAIDKVAAKKKADEEAAKLDKSKLDDKTRAYVEGLEKKLEGQGKTLDGIVKDRETAVTADLKKRVDVLKERGFAPDGDKPPEAEIRALEKAAEKFASHLKDIGVLDIKGSNDEPAGSAREAVAKAVREQLGREPVDAIEEATTRSTLYRANPGLLKSVLREERQLQSA